jgi:hypothetical protein
MAIRAEVGTFPSGVARDEYDGSQMAALKEFGSPIPRKWAMMPPEEVDMCGTETKAAFGILEFGHERGRSCFRGCAADNAQQVLRGRSLNQMLRLATVIWAAVLSR